MSSRTSQNIYDADPSNMPVGLLRDQQWNVPQSPWSAVFGDPRGTDSSIYDVSDRTTWTLPDAFAGRSKKLSDTIERMVFTDANWYLKEIMPFEIVQDANSVTWNEVHFDPHLTTPVPELGTVRLVRSERKTNTASWVRWGIGYYMEHGFMNTEEGIRYHIEHLQQMASAALETAKFDVMYTLLQAHDIEKRWEIEHGRFKGRRVDDLLSKDIWMFAALQKYQYPLNQLETYVNETMQKYGGRADTWILPPQIINYSGIALTEYLEQRKIGATGPEIILDGPRPYGMIAQNKVYIARTYHTSGFTGRENVLEHQREIGEYYKMFDLFPETCTDYCSRARSIKIYNEDNNNWFEVSLRWALDNSLLFDQEGQPTRPDQGEYQHRLKGMDAELDIFSYIETGRSGQPEVRHAEMFGELPDFYFSPRDKIGWAGTAREAMKRDFGEGEFQKIERDYNAGVDLLQEIDDLPWTPTAEAELLSRFANAAKDGKDAATAPNIAYNPRADDTTVHRIKEYAQDATFITGSGTLADTELVTLLPGLQSEPGLRYIIAKGKTNLPKKAEIAEKFISAVRKIVRALRKYAHESAFLKSKYASSWFWHPRDETTFVENLVMPYRPPLFLSADPKGVLGSNLATGSQVNYVQNAIDSIAANLATEVTYSPAGGSPNDKVAWFRYWALTAVSSMISTRKPADFATKLQTEFGGSGDSPMKLNFDTVDYGSDTVAGEADNIAAKLYELSKAKANVGTFTGIDSLEVAEDVLEKINEHFEEVYSKKQRSAEADVARPSIQSTYSQAALKTFHRSALLVSPAFAVSLFNAITAGPLRPVLPAHPDHPEVPIDMDTFDLYTLHLTERGADARHRDSRRPANLLKINPAWVSTISEQIHGAESVSFVANALSLEIGHSMDSSDFTGVQVESNMIGAQSAGGLGTRRTATAHALKAGVANKNLLDPYQRRGMSAAAEKHIGDADRIMSPNFLQSWSNVNELASNPIDRAVAHVFDTIPITYQSLSKMIDNDLRFPIGFYITRPHMTYRMLYGIKCLAGKEMGMTLMKPGLFEIGDDANTQAHIGTYTYYSKALVKNHQHVYIAKSIFCNGYDGGTGIRPVNPEDYQAANGNYTGQSIITLAVPYRDQIDGILSLTGRLTLGEYEDYDLTIDGDLQYITAARYNRIFGWNFARVDDQFETHPYDGVVERRFNNVLCHPGFQYYFNNRTKSFDMVSIGKGHFAQYTYDNVDQARAGMNVRFVEPDLSRLIRV